MTGTMADHGIQLEGVTVRFGAQSVVDDMTLSVPRGEVHVLLGASGAGKTTILRAVAGFVRIASGQIALDGNVVDDAGRRPVPPERRRVGIVFQNYALFPHISVAKNVAYGMASPSRAAVSGILERVGLAGYENRRPPELSGGEQQRVALARALAREPRVLLLDEPFSNLDPERRRDLRAETLRIIRQARLTTILVTHNAEEALEAADRATVIDEGRRVQTAAPQTLYAEPANLIVARSVGPVQTFPAVVSENGRSAQCLLGQVTLRGDRRTGDVLVRPEAIAVTDAQEGGDGALARVIGRYYRGSELELELCIGDRERFRARGRPTEMPPGDHVRARVSEPCVLV